MRGGNPEELKKGTQMGSRINQVPGTLFQSHQMQSSPFLILTAACRNKVEIMQFNLIIFLCTQTCQNEDWWELHLIDPLTCHRKKSKLTCQFWSLPSGVQNIALQLLFLSLSSGLKSLHYSWSF